jgi:hypothetical protein
VGWDSPIDSLLEVGPRLAHGSSCGVVSRFKRQPVMSAGASPRGVVHGPVVNDALGVRVFACSVGHADTFEHQEQNGALVLTLRNFTGQLICQSRWAEDLPSFVSSLENYGAYSTRSSQQAMRVEGQARVEDSCLKGLPLHTRVGSGRL